MFHLSAGSSPSGKGAGLFFVLAQRTGACPPCALCFSIILTRPCCCSGCSACVPHRCCTSDTLPHHSLPPPRLARPPPACLQPCWTPSCRKWWSSRPRTASSRCWRRMQVGCASLCTHACLKGIYHFLPWLCVFVQACLRRALRGGAGRWCPVCKRTACASCPLGVLSPRSPTSVDAFSALATHFHWL